MERNSLISERCLLRGAPNARDLGGLPTMDGRKVRAGVLLRSGELAGITDADAHTLSQYPLRTVIDFRTDLEREQKPDRVLAGVRYIHCPIVQQAAAGLTREEQADPYGAVVAHAKTMAGKERVFMCELYRGLVTREFSVDHYRQFFALLLAQTDGALLYHCTAGKDRVGVGTMLLLTALGVDWPVIVENYLITNERMAASTDCLLTAVKDYDLTEAERDVIRTFDSAADIVFLTSSPGFAYESYGVQALEYLLKPITAKKLFPLLSRLYLREQKPQEALTLKSNGAFIRVPFSELSYVEVSGKHLYFNMIDGQVREVVGVLREFEPLLLSRSEFMRIHRSYIVNMLQIRELSSAGVQTFSGQSLPVSRLLYPQLQKDYMALLFEQREG